MTTLTLKRSTILPKEGHPADQQRGSVQAKREISATPSSGMQRLDEIQKKTIVPAQMTFLATEPKQADHHLAAVEVEVAEVVVEVVVAAVDLPVEVVEEVASKSDWARADAIRQEFAVAMWSSFALFRVQLARSCVVHVTRCVFLPVMHTDGTTKSLRIAHDVENVYYQQQETTLCEMTAHLDPSSIYQHCRNMRPELVWSSSEVRILFVLFVPRSCNTSQRDRLVRLNVENECI